MRARKRNLSLSYALQQVVQQVETAEGMGLAEFFAALVNQGMVARLPILRSVLPPPASPEEQRLMTLRLADMARRREMGVEG